MAEAAGTVLRLYDAQGRLLLSDEEAKKAALQRADEEARRARAAEARVAALEAELDRLRH